MHAAIAAGGPGSVLLEGDPGIGKTTVWAAGVDAAARAGYRVLRAAPTEAERELAFAALGDLLEGVDAGVLAALPPPQRRALEVALLLDEDEGPPPDARALGVALVGVVRGLAADAPLLLAVDDAQWLDAASASALAFALRRLRDERVVLLVARRSGERGPELPLLAPVARVEVGPLSLGALGRLLRERVGASFRRPTLQQVRAVSGGNPFYALEIARAVAARGEPAPGDELPVPATLGELVRQRVAGLPAAVREGLERAALAGDPLLELTGLDEEALAAAAAAGVARAERGRVVFAHPILAAALVADADPERRRRLHRELAARAPGEEERARHLARAVDAPDEEAARTIEAAAQAARARGAPHAASELAEAAARLTPPEEQRPFHRRLRLAAESTLVAGDYARGRALFLRLLDALPPSPERARTALRFVRDPREMREAVDLLTRALADAEGDAPTQSDVLAFRALVRQFGSGDAAGARDDAALAAERAREAGDRDRELVALGVESFLALGTGGSFDLDALYAAADAELRLGEPQLNGPGDMLVFALGWTNRVEEARERGRAIVERRRSRGETSYAELLITLGDVELRLGDVEAAHETFSEGVELAAQVGIGQIEANLRVALAHAETYRGRFGEAEAQLARARELTREASDAWGAFAALRGLLALHAVRRDWEAAAAAADEALAAQSSFGEPDVDVIVLHETAADVYAAAGRDGDAEAAAAVLERAAEAAGATELRRLRALRARALVASAAGDDARAVAAAEAALELVRDTPLALERSRTRLVAGIAYRRARQRRLAREHLAAAAAGYRGAGAAALAERAEEELARLGGRSPSGSSLTATEERVAALAAEGRSTKEIAAALVVSPKTVEGHLTRIYEKLGVRSRAELAARLAG